MSPVAFARHLLSTIASASGVGGMFAGGTNSVSTGDAGDVFTGSIPSSPVIGSGSLSTVLDCFSSLIAGDSPLLAISNCLLSPIAGGGPLSTVSDRFLTLVVGDSPLSVVSGRLLSPIAGDGPSSAIFGSSLLSLVPPADSRALFLESTPSCARHSFLPSSLLFYFSLLSLPTLLAHNPTLFTAKRLFNQVFITQRPIALIW